jgi:transglutaminase-like putative cysteine protease
MSATLAPVAERLPQPAGFNPYFDAPIADRWSMGMRFNPQETTGSRVRIRYSVDLRYDVAGKSDFLLNVHAAVTSRQHVIEEEFSVSPEVPWIVETDEATGNRIAKFNSEAAVVTTHYMGLVDIEHHIVDPADVVAEAPSELPVNSLRFLYPSRYCPSDAISQKAWDLFGAHPRGYGQVRAVRDWVRENIQFKIGTSHSGTTAVDTLRDGCGVCRDFAHTFISYCRALNYPTRFCTGVDYGADPSLGPPDFHAYGEVLMGGRWYLFDATGISPITGLIRIGTGRDAADVSFATIFGPVRTGMPIVKFEAVEDAASGLVAPMRTELAVSTAD